MQFRAYNITSICIPNYALTKDRSNLKILNIVKDRLIDFVDMHSVLIMYRLNHSQFISQLLKMPGLRGFSIRAQFNSDSLNGVILLRPDFFYL